MNDVVKWGGGRINIGIERIGHKWRVNDGVESGCRVCVEWG